MLIVGDGPSEETYFGGFIGRSRSIKVIPKGVHKSDLNKILSKAISLAENKHIDLSLGDRIAVVTDIDGRYDNLEIVNMSAAYTRNGCELYLSNPCFEVWLTLHFRNTVGTGDCRELTKDLDSIMRKDMDHGYSKSAGIGWDEDMLDKAVSNASALHKGQMCSAS